MKYTTGTNEYDRRQRPGGSAQDEALAELMSSCTPRQRKTLAKGFRILARSAVHTHMKRQEPGPDEPTGRGEEEG